MTALAAEPEALRYSEIQQSGIIDDRRVVEASGLARSHRVAGRMWTMNDGGSRPQLFALDANGVVEGAVVLGRARNVDWEALASFEHGGKAMLVVADIGDNLASRRYCTMYVVEEPGELQGQRVEPLRAIRFTYPEGPRDAEGLAVDPDNLTALVLSKRTIPARLYRVPLFASAENAILQAEHVADIAHLPQPTARDLERALPDKSWHWQPTAMDIAPDGNHAVILTYRAAYLYSREPQQSWPAALQNAPLRLDLGGIRLAEAAAFGYKDPSLFITVEGRRPPLYRFERNP